MGLKSLYYSYRSQALTLKVQQRMMPFLLLVLIGYILNSFFPFYTLDMGLMFIFIGVFFLIKNFLTILNSYKEYTNCEFYKKKLVVTYDERSISFSTDEKQEQKYNWKELIISSCDKFGLRFVDQKGKHLFSIPIYALSKKQLDILSSGVN